MSNHTDLTLDVMAERLREHIYGPANRDDALQLLSYALTGLPPGPTRDTALATILFRLADATPGEASGEGVDARIAGLDFAADIAAHWHQRYTTLALDLPDTAKAREVNALGFKAVGAKKVLDEIRAERARLASPSPARSDRAADRQGLKTAEEIAEIYARVSDPRGLLYHVANAREDAALAAAPMPAPEEVDVKLGLEEALARRVTVPYTNWRGEFNHREIAPIRLFWGSNKWHTKPQWLIEALDVAKSEIRTFALTGLAQPAPASGTDVEALRVVAEPFAVFASKVAPRLKLQPEQNLHVETRSEVPLGTLKWADFLALRTVLGTSGREG